MIHVLFKAPKLVFRRVLKHAGLVGAWLGLTFVFVAGIALILAGLVILTASQNDQPNEQASKLIDLSPQLFSQEKEWLYVSQTQEGYWRFPVELAQVDERYLAALLAYEDKRFYTHYGIDPLALLRASWQWLTQGKVVSGASTITMQVAKLLEPQPRTLNAKLSEMVRALQLERRWSKQEILEAYLTLIPMGGNLEGIHAASHAYFGHSPNTLTLGEIALLVALPQSPEARRPDRHPQRALQGREAVLERLVATQLITQQEATWANDEPIATERIAFPRHAYHYAQRQILNQAKNHTHINLELQVQIERLLAESGLNAPERNFAVLVIDTSADALTDARVETILAYAGSKGIDSNLGFNDMVTAVRSPASTLKPFIYALAYQSAIAYPKTIIRDEPISIQGFAPLNYDRHYRGEVTVAEALTHSLNVPAVKLLSRVGAGELFEFMRQQGAEMRLPKDEVPSLAIGLGGGGLTMFEQSKLYAQLTRSGDYFSETVKSMVYESLPNIRGFAYKTGTSYGHRDAWVFGYNSTQVVGVWTGRIDGTPIEGQSGALDALPLLNQILALLPKSQGSEFDKARYTLPEFLTHFDAPNARHQADDARVTQIEFPLNQQTYFLNRETPLRIKLSQAADTQMWINGEQVTLEQDSKGRLLWFPQSSGFYQLEAQDRRSRVHVRIEER